MTAQRLILASASPRRRELLARLVREFQVQPAAVDESPAHGEDPEQLASRLAEAKARAVHRLNPACAVIGSDTVVALERQVLGKPSGAAEVEEMLYALSGRRHRVISAVALVTPDRKDPEIRLSITQVEFASLPRSWIVAYARTPEPMDKAGAYAIQGAAGAWIRHIEGSYSGVVGLPLYETAVLLRQAGLLGEAGPLPIIDNNNKGLTNEQ